MATIRYSDIQGTLTSQLRSPRSPRKIQEHQDAAEKVKCLQCWKPNPKPHPCLFCKKCLDSVLKKGTSENDIHTTRTQATTAALLSTSNSFDSQDSDLTAWEKYRSKSVGVRHPRTAIKSSHHGNQLRTPRTQEVIINSSLGDHLHAPAATVGLGGTSLADDHKHLQRPDDRVSKEIYVQYAQWRRNAILQKKAHDFQRTASRCGFCQEVRRQRPLVAYCIHCRKHLCKEHRDYHRSLRVFRPHATVNIGDGTNQGLM